MSLPNGFLDELRSRVSLSQVVGRKVLWDQKKSNQAKGDLWAPCPFHQEKTASFHVDDRKGFYYCFGCHQKGDAISFVRETENVGFMEAVEILAREAGMPIPQRDPEAQKQADRRSLLAEVTEAASRHFRMQLKTGAGAAARDYLASRGLDDAAIERWGIGFAPPGWQGLRDHLTGRGVSDELLLAAGLTRASDKGRDPYDVFRDRIMFPICDVRGRVIAFGGRAMDPDDGAKYLNSPETELFDKGRTLFNHGPAREAAGKGQPLVVAEGYMDVIALSEAGFAASVAPLGTAVTETQLALLWRMHPEPLVALDGDRAGIAAAIKLMDLAMPRLEAGQSLRFALMPEGQDPDDVIRRGGRAAMQDVLGRAMPLVDLLWRRETEGQSFDSPERRAALDKALRTAISRIQDPSLRRHYGAAIDERRRALFSPGGGKGRGPGRDWRPRRGAQLPSAPSASARASFLATAEEAAADRLREAVILATCITHPDLVEEFESDLERMELTLPEHEEARRTLLRNGSRGKSEDLRTEIAPHVLEKLFGPRHVQIAPGVRPGATRDAARMCLAEEIAKLTAARGARRDIEDAVADFSDLPDEGLTWRLAQAAEARDRAARAPSEDRTEYDVADNGVRIARNERDAFAAVLASADPRRGGRKTPSGK